MQCRGFWTCLQSHRTSLSRSLNLTHCDLRHQRRSSCFEADFRCLETLYLSFNPKRKGALSIYFKIIVQVIHQGNIKSHWYSNSGPWPRLIDMDRILPRDSQSRSEQVHIQRSGSTKGLVDASAKLFAKRMLLAQSRGALSQLDASSHRIAKGPNPVRTLLICLSLDE
jgi:hypothetical protein